MHSRPALAALLLLSLLLGLLPAAASTCSTAPDAVAPVQHDGSGQVMLRPADPLPHPTECAPRPDVPPAPALPDPCVADAVRVTALPSPDPVAPEVSTSETPAGADAKFRDPRHDVAPGPSAPLEVHPQSCIPESNRTLPGVHVDVHAPAERRPDAPAPDAPAAPEAPAAPAAPEPEAPRTPDAPRVDPDPQCAGNVCEVPEARSEPAAPTAPDFHRASKATLLPPGTQANTNTSETPTLSLTYFRPDARDPRPLTRHLPHAAGMPYQAPDAPEPTEGERASYTRPAIASADGAPAPMPTRADALTWASARTAAALLFLLAPLALYHRIRGQRVARQRTRAAILDAITERPGLVTQEAADASGVTYTTADYHLKRLQKEGVVIADARGGRIRYYLAGVGFTEAKRAEDAALASPERRALLDTVRAHPEGVSKSALSRLLGVARSTIDWHLRDLLDAGLVRRERAGREVRILAARSAPATTGADGEAATG